MTTDTFKAPPPQREVPLIHESIEFYKKVYQLGHQVTKRERFGIYIKIETISLELIQNILTASFEHRQEKLFSLRTARTNIEILKRLFRICVDLEIVKPKAGLDLQSKLQDLSKMTNGWIKYLQP